MEPDKLMSADALGRIKGLALAVLLSPLYLLFVHFGDETRGVVVTCITAVAIVSAYVQRKKANRIQLWLLVALLYCLELPVALLFPLPDSLLGATMIPISFANLFLLLGIVSLYQRWCGGREVSG